MTNDTIEMYIERITELSEMRSEAETMKDRTRLSESISALQEALSEAIKQEKEHARINNLCFDCKSSEVLIDCFGSRTNLFGIEAETILCNSCYRNRLKKQFQSPHTQTQLCDMFEMFCKQALLPMISANELLCELDSEKYNFEIIEADYCFVGEFLKAWEEWEQDGKTFYELGDKNNA